MYHKQNTEAVICLKECDPIDSLVPHFTPSKLRFWYQKKAHIFLIPVKFEAWEMFPFEVMNKNVNKRWLPPKTAHTILWAILVHIFVCTIHTAGSIQLKICNWVFLVICFHVREKASYEKSESDRVTHH